VISALAKLKYELQHNRELSPLPEDSEGDIAGYNKELEALGNPKWHSVPWLYAECYLYRYSLSIAHASLYLTHADNPRKTHRHHLHPN